MAVFFYDFFLLRELTTVAAASRAGLLAFSVIAMGGVGSVLAGVWADRFGRERITIWSMAVSGLCSLTLGWLVCGPILLVVVLTLLWGFTIVAGGRRSVCWPSGRCWGSWRWCG
ncbi:MAG: hypothetical protein WEB88_15330 [Gemmatimonadota bacterium]